MVHIKVRRPFASLMPLAVIFLSLIIITAARSAEDPKIVLLGECNSGKSTLGNIILGQSPYNNPPLPFEICSEVCKKSNGNDLCTRNPSLYEGEISWLDEPPAITIVDIPGIGCSGQNDKQLLEDMIQFLRNDVNTTNAFVLTFDGLETHFSLSKIEQLVHEIESTFGFSFWDNTVLAVTNWHYDEDSIEKRGNHDENWWKEKMNGALQENFHLKSNLDAVFIDACYDYESHDEENILRDEIGKLWNATLSFDPFFLLTFDEMKEQFQNCNDKFDEDIQYLQNQIDNLSSMKADKEDIEDLKENVTNLEVNIDSIENNIGDTNITKLGDDVMSNGQRIDSIESNIGDTDISKLSDDVNSNGVRIDTIESNIGDTDISMLNDDICDIQTNLSTLENKPRFAAEKRPSSDEWLPTGDIIGFTELADFGGIFNPATGRLTINDEHQGTYVLKVSAHKNGNNGHGQKGYIEVYKNGEVVQYINENDEDHDLMMNAVFTLYLHTGDEVKLYNYWSGSVWLHKYYPLTFIGYKI